MKLAHLQLGKFIMRVKTPRTLVTFPQDTNIVVYNYLSRDAISCAVADLYWLTIAPEWTDVDEIALDHPEIEPDSVKREIARLVESGVLLQEGTTEAAAETQYSASWELGPAVGMFHFSVLDNSYGDTEESVRKQNLRAISDPSPELYWRNSGSVIQLPRHSTEHGNELLKLMSHRRSRRNVLPEPISLEALSECLFAGLGITGFVKSQTAILPLKMTPSGGARNPFEGYVWARNVEGLPAGIYHYSAVEHSLQWVGKSPQKQPQDFVQKQDWADNMPALIFLVAVLERVTWKYSDPNAYRVVMIEAGHIAQNMMLACTKNQLTACPTAALSHKEISAILGLTRITQTPIYALLVGKPSEVSDTTYTLEEAAQLRLIA